MYAEVAWVLVSSGTQVQPVVYNRVIWDIFFAYILLDFKHVQKAHLQISHILPQPQNPLYHFFILKIILKVTMYIKTIP